MCVSQNICEKFALSSTFSWDIFHQTVNTTEMKRNAFLGDAILLLSIRRRVVKYSQNDTGILTVITSIYVCNKNLSQYMKMLYKSEDMPTYSQHQDGTLFEALLATSNDTEKAINHYVCWIENEFTDLLKQVKTGEIRELGELGELGELTNDKLMTEDNERYDKYFEILLSKSKEVSSLNRSLNPLRENLVPFERYAQMNLFEESFDHDRTTILLVEWKSLSNKFYESRFYGCCGCAVDSWGLNYRTKCLRSDWNRDAIHVGKLQIVSNSRIGGGSGSTHTSNDHKARCKTPYWSCCGRLADAEGCNSLAASVDGQFCTLKRKYNDYDSITTYLLGMHKK